MREQVVSIETPEIKLYFDYKSPYAYLAMSPALDLPDKFNVTIRCIPYLLRLKGKGRAQRLFRVEGEVFLHGCKALG